MESGDLRIFEAVARLGSLTGAAAELHTVQSNVTARIRHLEAELGVPVFRRHSRGVTLTPAGERLLPHAVKVAQVIDAAVRSVRDGDRPRGPLRLGALETVTALRLPPILAKFVQRYPEVNLSLMTGTTRQLIEEVCGYKIEGAFIAGSARHPDLEETQVWREELVLVTHPGITSLEEALDPVREVKVVVFRQGCSYREQLELFLGERGLTPVRRLEFGTVDGILGCAAAGLGVGLMPRASAERAQRNLAIGIHRLPAERAYSSTCFIRRRDSVASPALLRFLDCAVGKAAPSPRPAGRRRSREISPAPGRVNLPL